MYKYMEWNVNCQPILHLTLGALRHRLIILNRIHHIFSKGAGSHNALFSSPYLLQGKPPHLGLEIRKLKIALYHESGCISVVYTCFCQSLCMSVLCLIFWSTTAMEGLEYYWCRLCVLLVLHSGWHNNM